MRIVTLHTGNKYGLEYVEKLYRGLMRNLTMPFDFEVHTQSKYPGWWGKLDIFPPTERIVFLDLDTIVTGNVDFLFEYDGPFAILRDFYRPNGYGSAVMSISAGFGESIKRNFEENPLGIMTRYRGDQNWIEKAAPNADLWQDLYPGQIKSFKADNLEAGPNGASLVCFHGVPKPHEITHLDWVREHWR